MYTLRFGRSSSLNFTAGRIDHDYYDYEGPGKARNRYRRIFHDVTLPRQRKNWSIMATQGATAGGHFYYKRERNIVLQLE